MKLNAWLLFALAPLTAISVLAQTPNPVPPTPAPSPAASAAPTAEPAAKPAKKHKAKAKPAKTAKPAAVKGSSIVLNPPVTATVKCDVLDVRGQGSFAGEVIGRVKKGESVTVVEEITLGHVHPNEPAQWSRIVMPANIPVWVSAEFIDSATKAVRVKKINVRGGPGENYSVVGGLDKGTVVKEIGKKEGWLQIETPTNTFAFVASEYLEMAPEASAPIVAVAAPAPAPVVAPVPVVVNVPAETPPPVPAKPAETASAGLTAPAPTAASQADELAALHRATAPEPLTASASVGTPQSGVASSLIPRIVTREGLVHRSYNIQSPADFELCDIKTGELTEYLQPAAGQKFKKYVGTRVRVIGAESLDPRWPRTPVLQIQTLELMP